MLGLEITGSGAVPRLSSHLECPRPAAGQTLVKMAAVALGHLDLSVASGAFPSQPRLPYVPCGDGAGWVAVSRPERAAFVPEGAACRVTGADAGPFGAGEFDVLIDTIGGPGLAARLDSVRAGGVAVIVGYTAGTVVSLDLPARCAHDVELRFLNMIRRAPDAFAIAGDLLASLSAGELTLRMDAYPLSGAATAWQALAHGTATGRVVLEVGR